MAKVRTLKCSVHDDCTFEYIGHGRPPKFCPAAKQERVKQQRKDARKRAKDKKAPRVAKVA